MASRRTAIQCSISMRFPACTRRSSAPVSTSNANAFCTADARTTVLAEISNTPLGLSLSELGLSSK